MVLPSFKVGLHFIVSASFDLSKIHSEMCLTDDFKPSQVESGEWLTESSSSEVWADSTWLTSVTYNFAMTLF